MPNTDLDQRRWNARTWAWTLNQGCSIGLHMLTSMGGLVERRAPAHCWLTSDVPGLRLEFKTSQEPDTYQRFDRPILA